MTGRRVCVTQMNECSVMMAGSEENTQQPRTFNMRIINLDFYMSRPLPGFDVCYSEFQGCGVLEVPVIRVYGPTILGQKTCLHLHKAFPYFYIPYHDDLPKQLEEAQAYIHALGFALEKAMKLTSNIGSKRQHVHSCSLVRAKKFYGFHLSEDIFIKIVLYHPQDVSRMSAVLLGGGIMNRKFQPYESHIPYLLQFLVDNNLSGMGHLHLSKLRFRCPTPDYPRSRENLLNHVVAVENASNGLMGLGCLDDAGNKEGLWLTGSIPSEWLLTSFSDSDASDQTRNINSKMSTCELEADAKVEDILNRDELLSVPLSRAGPEIKLVQSLTSIWEERKLWGIEDASGKEAEIHGPSDVQSVCEERLNRALARILEEDAKILQDQCHLLECSQLANAKDSCEAQPKDKSEPSACSPEVASVLDGSQVDEERVKSQLIQSVESKDLDDEAMELLKWMAGSQQNVGPEDGEMDEINMEAGFCHLEHGNVAEAIRKSATEHEMLSQLECQDILDCVDEVTEEHQPHHQEPSIMDRPQEVQQIPQYDGAGDEDDHVSKKLWGNQMDVFVRDNIQEEHALPEKGPSLRDLMRMKRARRPSRQDTIMPGCLPTKVLCIEDTKARASHYGELPLVTKGRDVEGFADRIYHKAINEQEADEKECRKCKMVDEDRVLEQYADNDEFDNNLVRNKQIEFREITGNDGCTSEVQVHCSSDSAGLRKDSSKIRSTVSLKKCTSGTSSLCRSTIFVNEDFSELQQSTCHSKEALQDGISTLDVEGRENTFVFYQKPPKKSLMENCANLSNVGNTVDNAKGGLHRNALLAEGLSGRSILPSFYGHEASLEPPKHKNYENEQTWIPEGAAGIPTYFENDGTASYILTPLQAPPCPLSVMNWLEHEGPKPRDVLKQKEPAQSSSLDLNRPSSPKYNEGHNSLQGCTPNRSTFSRLEALKEPQSCSAGGSIDAGHKAKLRKSIDPKDFSQITAPALQSTPLSQAGFCHLSSMCKGQQVTLMSVEMHAESRGDLHPDPRYDAICFIIVVMKYDSAPAGMDEHIIVLSHGEHIQHDFRGIQGLTGSKVIDFATEISLLEHFIHLVQVYDPDILIGWDIQRFSIGYLAERAANMGMGLIKRLSRVPPKESVSNFSTIDRDIQQGGLFEVPDIHEVIIDDEWGRTHGSGIYIVGRTVLNLWRIMRGELKLGIYSFEAVVEAVLRRRVPYIPWNTLTRWFISGRGESRFRCIQHFIVKTRLNLQMIDQLDLVNRTAELARIFGIDFFSVFSRGSQYRVESMMLRLAHSQNYLLISPSKEQVMQQPAMQCLPLVMEPESRLYTSPVVVLDFQSLYPSMIIAYNLCFSTCLGRITSANPKVLGVSSLSLHPAVLSKLKDHLMLSPNEILYASPEVVPGVLPRLLQEILATRIMVKSAMKKLPSSERVLQRILNARQFALKLISNVTYGYTAAGFSGRMPCAELADSIVQYGRDTLEKAIKMVNSNSSWNARVVYGDTDSMFVLLEGRTREEAFRIGQDIAAAVTAANPQPVMLKLEKVYHPCILIAKKRYVGYSYESFTQVKPVFDAKGIETVRRDSCAAVAKTMERSLRVLFETYDVLQVKQYLQRQWKKIISGRVSLSDFIFAKEVRLGTYSSNSSTLPPAAIVASKAMQADPRAEPCYGERIRYIVVCGEPGARLADMVVDPYLLINGTMSLQLHATYYITKQIIPALQRTLGLAGMNVLAWYNMMPRMYKPSLAKRNTYFNSKSDGITNRGTIDKYYLSKHCAVCGKMTQGTQSICQICSDNQQIVAVVLKGRVSRLEKNERHLQAVCRHCRGDDGSLVGEVACISLDCPVFFERQKAKKEFENITSFPIWEY